MTKPTESSADETNGGSAVNHSGEGSSRKEAGHHKVQPTTEQVMLAKIIDTTDDVQHQKQKIQQVQDVTGKAEDEVATALFDAGWDENRAIGKNHSTNIPSTFF